jgi:hypothetical protein
VRFKEEGVGIKSEPSVADERKGGSMRGAIRPFQPSPPEGPQGLGKCMARGEDT